MLIRDATRADAVAISALHNAAFGGGAEARLVAALEADGDTIVSLVTEIEGAIVGHVLYSRMTVEADGKILPAAGLAPVGVFPHYQRLGLGSMLIRDGLARLSSLGIRIVFVLGDPAYYERFGFSANLAAPYASPYAGPHFMALNQDTEFARPQAGRADYAKAFSLLG